MVVRLAGLSAVPPKSKLPTSHETFLISLEMQLISLENHLEIQKNSVRNPLLPLLFTCMCISQQLTWVLHSLQPSQCNQKQKRLFTLTANILHCNSPYCNTFNSAFSFYLIEFSFTICGLKMMFRHNTISVGTLH